MSAGSGGPKNKERGNPECSTSSSLFWGRCSCSTWRCAAGPSGINSAPKGRKFPPGSGLAQSRHGAAYVLEFETAGGSHRLHYPKAAKGKGFAEGETVTLYYDPDDLEKMYVEGDKAVLGAEVLYAVLGVVLLVLMAGFARL